MKKFILTLALLCAACCFPRVAEAAITLGSHGQTNCASGANSCSTSSFAVATGDLLVFACHNTSGTNTATVTDTLSESFTVLFDTSDGTNWDKVWYVKNASSGTETMTCNNSTTGTSLHILWAQYSGVDTAAPLDGSSAATGSATCSPGNIVTANANDVLVGMKMGSQWGGTYTSTTVTSGFTVRNDDGSTGHHGTFADQVVSATGTYTCAITYNGGGGLNAWCFVAGFKAAVVNPASARKPMIF